MKKRTKQLVTAALLIALICVATMIIKIPSPFKGYLNLGDAMVLFSGWILPPVYGFFAAAAGSALADIFSGYAIYAPATFLIKGITAFSAQLIFKQLSKKTETRFSRILSGMIAEAFMVLGYYAFEGILYGFVPSAVNIIPNAVQGAAGLILSLILIKIFKKTQIKL